MRRDLWVVLATAVPLLLASGCSDSGQVAAGAVAPSPTFIVPTVTPTPGGVTTPSPTAPDEQTVEVIEQEPEPPRTPLPTNSPPAGLRYDPALKIATSPKSEDGLPKLPRLAGWQVRFEVLSNGCVVGQEGEVPVWPYGSTVWRDARGRIVVVSPSGKVIGRSGYNLGGGGNDPDGSLCQPKGSSAFGVDDSTP